MRQNIRPVFLVAGARPNFMKVAPLWHEFTKYRQVFRSILVHTGQHYDGDMSDVFLRDLALPAPDKFLGGGSGTHAEQTAKVMVQFELACLQEPPDLVVVVGDVNSTLACAITAKKMCVPVAHVEAGLRSGDWTMPEEINRVVTDRVSDYLFTPSRDADANLRREGVASKRIFFVGNIMIDTLIQAKKVVASKQVCRQFGLCAGQYGLITLHRPPNVDKKEPLEQIFKAFGKLDGCPLLFPIHPRTRRNLTAFGMLQWVQKIPSLHLANPLGYYDFLDLLMHARFVVTDSGGVQEETTYLGVPCLTLREQTERPVTISEGTNELVTVKNLPQAVEKVLGGFWKKGRIPDLWDGKAAERIVRVLLEES